MAEQYKSLHPIKYYRDYLSNKVRPDGRAFEEFRPIVINVDTIDTADGSAIVKVGKTTVICGIKAELCKPKPDSPNKGFVIPNLELPPLCSPTFRPGPPSEQAQVLTQLIADIIGNSGCVDLSQLCIHADRLAWCLYADFICLDFDGAVIDACIIALQGALQTVKLPFVAYDAALDNIQVNVEDRKKLEIQSTPISTSFAVFDDKIILADPTVEEETLCSGIVTIVIKEDEICYVHKPGGSPMSDEDFFSCVDRSKSRVSPIKELINTALQNLP